MSRYAKLARAAYYQAIDGRAHDREWLTLSPDERTAWASVAWVLTNVAPGNPSKDEEILQYAREALAEPKGAPCPHVFKQQASGLFYCHLCGAWERDP